jgi:hypothetical protein
MCRIVHECGLGPWGAFDLGNLREFSQVFLHGDAELRDVGNNLEGINCAMVGHQSNDKNNCDCIDVKPRDCRKCCACKEKDKNIIPRP